MLLLLASVPPLPTMGAQVSVRYVLLKGYDERGFVFYTNYDSEKVINHYWGLGRGVLGREGEAADCLRPPAHLPAPDPNPLHPSTPPLRLPPPPRRASSWRATRGRRWASGGRPCSARWVPAALQLNERFLFAYTQLSLMHVPVCLPLAGADRGRGGESSG